MKKQNRFYKFWNWKYCLKYSSEESSILKKLSRETNHKF